MDIRKKEEITSLLEQQYQAINDDYIDIRAFINDLKRTHRIEAKTAVQILAQLEKMTRNSLKYTASIEDKLAANTSSDVSYNGNVILLDSARK